MDDKGPVMKRFISYEKYGRMSDRLCSVLDRLIPERHDKVGIYGPPRGGLPIAVHVSHQLGCKYLHSFLSNSNYGPQYYTLRDVSHIVVVDDICDTGGTFNKLAEDLNKLNMPIYFASLFYNPGNCKFNPSIGRLLGTMQKDNFIFVEPTDQWIVFPWERDDSETIRDIDKPKEEK